MNFTDTEWLWLFRVAKALEVLGISQNVFCADVSVAPSTFCRHKKRLRTAPAPDWAFRSQMPARLKEVVRRYRAALEKGLEIERAENSRLSRKGSLA